MTTTDAAIAAELQEGLAPDTGPLAPDRITHALQTVRSHLNMEIGYLSEFVDGRSVLRAVDAPGLEEHVGIGDSFALEEIYCPHIIAGRLPELIADTAAVPFTQQIPITNALPIGSHVSIPIRRDCGEVYGMFCCLSTRPNPTLNDRDLAVMRIFADLAARDVNQEISHADALARANLKIDQALAPGGYEVHYQPIFELGAARPAGFEALCRFQVPPYRSPDKWFRDAAEVGRQAELELAVIEQALRALDRLPQGATIAVNASPATVLEDALADVLCRTAPEQVVLEITEHAEVGDYDVLNAALDRVRVRGVRLAVDDAGAGYAGLQHILLLRPDFIKLDMSLTRDIDNDCARRSLVVAMKHYARDTSSVLIAEGIETEAELQALRELGVTRGQGYHLGRPVPADVAFALPEDLDARATGTG